jgi:MipA family protein
MKAAPSLAAAALAALLLAAAPSAAQRPDRIVTIGAGAQVHPRYPGADSVGVYPMGIFDLRRVGEPLAVESPDESWGFGFLRRGSGVNFGPAVRFLGSRKLEHVGAPVDRVGRTVEVGGFAQAYLTPGLRLRAEARKGLGGHEGWLGDVMADAVIRGEERYVFSVGPRIRIADERYMNAFYGVTPAAAARTGLPVYVPDGGIHAAGVAAGLRYQVNSSWGIHAHAGYDRLVGDAADSPIVRAFGSRDQLYGGLGLSYSFRLRR